MPGGFRATGTGSNSIQGGKEIGRVPMSGFHHALDRYCNLLVERYAIAMRSGKNASVAGQSRQVRREVTRVLTPGTLLDDGMLNAVVITIWQLCRKPLGLGLYRYFHWRILTTQASNLDS